MKDLTIVMTQSSLNKAFYQNNYTFLINYVLCSNT